MYSAMFLLGMASKVSCKIFLYSKLPITYIQARLLEAAVNRHSPQSIFTLKLQPAPGMALLAQLSHKRPAPSNRPAQMPQRDSCHQPVHDLV